MKKKEEHYFKLYGNVGNWQKLDQNANEEYIIHTMLDYANKCHLYNFLIIERKDNTDYFHRRIFDEKEFKDYLIEYRDRTAVDKSCVELKRSILKRAGYYDNNID